MRWPSLLSVSLVVTTSSIAIFAQDSHPCNYGVGYGTDVYCTSRESAAMDMIAEAKTICLSGNSQIQWNKKTTKEPTWAWAAIRAGEGRATRDFTVAACEHADLVVKYVYDDSLGNVKMDVTDADSGNIVFEESRDVSDLSSDTVRMAEHWRGMIAAARQRQSNLAEEYARQQKEEAQTRKCQDEFDGLQRNIISYLEVQHATVLPVAILDQIHSHNERCANSINPEEIIQHKRAEADQQHAQEQAEKDRAAQEKRKAILEKSKSNALIAFTNQLVSVPFVPPVNGWTKAAGLGTASYYIILPGKGLASDCHFAMDGNRPALDCLGSSGRNDYFAVQNNEHWYLLKSKWAGSGEYAGTVKDGGSTLCLRKAGCYRVLAEVREAPTTLPDKIQVPAPGNLTLTYSNDDLSFSYPQNWHADEPKTKDNVRGLQVGVAPPEANLASWLTHGMLVGHVPQFSQSPQTLDGAFDHFSSIGKQLLDMTISTPKLTQFGDLQGDISTYTAPSVLSAGESGWLLVVKDNGEGYYWMMMFYPSNDDSRLYAQTFEAILKTVKLKK